MAITRDWRLAPEAVTGVKMGEPLRDKNAVIDGAGGAIGGAASQESAREGARVLLTGRSLAKVVAVAKAMSAIWSVRQGRAGRGPRRSGD